MVDARRTENLAQLEAVEKSQWVESQAEVLAAQVQHAAQIEAVRYHAACQLLTDFYYGAMGVGLPEPRSQVPRIDALRYEDPAEDAAAAGGKKEPAAKAKAKAK